MAGLVFVLTRAVSVVSYYYRRFFHSSCGNLKAAGEYDYRSPSSTIALTCYLPTVVFETKVSLTMYSERVVLGSPVVLHLGIPFEFLCCRGVAAFVLTMLRRLSETRLVSSLLPVAEEKNEWLNM
jgi:hypothetical protein